MKPAICLQYQTRLMLAPAFWYYAPDNQEILNQDLRALHAAKADIEIRCTEIPDFAWLFERPKGIRLG